MVNQQALHDVRRKPQKRIPFSGAVLGGCLQRSDADQFQIKFINKRRGLKRMVHTLRFHPEGCDTA